VHLTNLSWIRPALSVPFHLGSMGRKASSQDTLLLPCYAPNPFPALQGPQKEQPVLISLQGAEEPQKQPNVQNAGEQQLI
jgi:hypothetical protein